MAMCECVSCGEFGNFSVCPKCGSRNIAHDENFYEDEHEGGEDEPEDEDV